MIARGAALLLCVGGLTLAPACACEDGPGDGAASDAGIPPDAREDAGRRAVRDTGPPVCGDGVVEHPEGCDDGNLADGDGCTAGCRLPPACGDGVVAEGEICDDGANAAADGCAPDCASTETCGDGRRDLPSGELCDDGNEIAGDGCEACALPGCGDGTLAAELGEQCDDGGRTGFDGCGADCLREAAFVLNSLAMTDPATGCDFSGDGTGDNRLAAAMGSLRPPLNSLIRNRIHGGARVLLTAYDLHDPSDDPFVRLAWILGLDADGDIGNDFLGDAEMLARATSYRPAIGAAILVPVSWAAGSIAGGLFEAGPEDLLVRIPLFSGGGDWPLALRRVRIHATMDLTPTEDGRAEATGLRDGLLCGALPVNHLGQLENPVAMFPGGDGIRGCDGSTETTFADAVVGGILVVGIRSRPSQPDVDLDHDGVEWLVADADGPSGCQPVIVACVDGDGTRIEGRDCALDPRIADGWSAALSFGAVGARVVGVTGR